MQFKFASILAVVSAALAVSAMPSVFLVQEQYDAVSLDQPNLSTLPESGEIVSTPVSFIPDDTTGDYFTYRLDEDGDMTEEMFDDWKNLVVNSHNKFRAKYGAPNLSWSDALYPGTQQWAQQCKFQHR